MLTAVAAAVSLCSASCSKPASDSTSGKTSAPAPGSIIRLDPALDSLIPAGAKVEKIAGGFKFLEGPLWRPSGVLWFSDLVGNVAYQWNSDGKVNELLKPGGYEKNDAPEGSYIGPNGMTAGPDNTVTLCQHGNRRIVSISADKKLTMLVDRFEGKRLNSPNDVVYTPDGALYFTDPPFGLPKQDDDPAKELKFNGVFRFSKGKVEPVIRDLTKPNGIAFSPDYKTLYISVSDKRVWMRYDVTANGQVANGRVLLDASSAPEQDVPDGMKVDSLGNIYASGPGGIWVIAPDGKHLGTIKMPEPPSNCAWGDDGKTLYITAVTGLYRIRLNVAGETLVYN